MSSKWISVSDALSKTGKSEITIRRYISEHKDNASIIKKHNGKVLINTDYLYQTYQPINDLSNDSAEKENKHKKEAMQIAYNSEIIKRKDEHLKVKDHQIELLINRRSYLPLWLTVGFVILILGLGYLGYLYRSELVNNFNSKIADAKTNYQSEASYLKKDLAATKKDLTKTTVAWQQSLKAIDLLHIKYGEKLSQEDAK